MSCVSAVKEIPGGGFESAAVDSRPRFVFYSREQWIVSYLPHETEFCE